MKYTILQKAIDLSLIWGEEIIKYWLYDVRFHDWNPSSFNDEPLEWLFNSIEELLSHFKGYEINKKMYDFYAVANAVHNDYKTLFNLI